VYKSFIFSQFSPMTVIKEKNNILEVSGRIGL